MHLHRITMANSPSSSQGPSSSQSSANNARPTIPIEPKQTYIREITEFIARSPAVLFGDKSFDDDHVILSFENMTMSSSDNGSLGAAIGSNSYICSVCLGIPREPCSLLRCGHIGCEKCFMEYLVTGNSQNVFSPRLEIGTKACPQCREIYCVKDIVKFRSWPMLSKNLWTLMRMKCENCLFYGSPMTVVDHERNNCDLRRVQCPGCPAIACVDETIKHALACKHVLVYCVECGYPIRYQLRDLHDCGKFIYSLRRRPDIDMKTGRKGAVCADTIIPSEDWQALWTGDTFDDSMSPTTPANRDSANNITSPLAGIPPGAGNVTLSDLAGHERTRRLGTSSSRPMLFQTPPRVEDVPSSQPRHYDVPSAPRRRRRSSHRNIFE